MIQAKKTAFFSYALPFLLCLIQLSSTVAQSKSNSADAIEKKSKLEALITDQIEKLIGVSLEKKSYDVSVSVVLAPIDPDQKTPPQEPSNEIKRPEDLAMGLLNAEDLINQYQKEIETLRLAKTKAEKNSKESQYEVRQIFVSVGLHSSLDEAYVNEFRSWLEKQIKLSFGNLGKVNVGRIKTLPTLNPVETQPKLIDYAKDFQALISVLLTIIGVIIAALLLRSMTLNRKDSDKKIRHEGSEPKQQNVSKISGDAGNIESSIAPTAKPKNRVELLTASDLMKKIVLLATQSDVDLNKAIETWLDNDTQGLMKTSCIFDSLLSVDIGGENDGDKMKVIRGVIIPDNFKADIASTLSKMKQIEADAHLDILQSTYWDLLSFQTLGDQFLKRPFAYTSSVNPVKLKEAVLLQNERHQAISVLAFPEQAKEKIISTLSTSEKYKILESALDIFDIDNIEINSISDSLKAVIQGTSTSIEKIQTLSLLLSFMKNLNPLEEVESLLKLKQQRPADAINLRKEWPTLAFFEDWTVASQTSFLSRCNNEELEVFCSIMPDISKTVLELVSPRVREIVSDGIKLAREFEEESKIKHLGNMQKKLLMMLEKKELKLTSIYKEIDSENVESILKAS